MQKILDFQTLYPDVGYRRLTYMMIDADLVAVSPSTVWRVSRQSDRLSRGAGAATKGFERCRQMG